jgi:hypothetical protein
MTPAGHFRRRPSRQTEQAFGVAWPIGIEGAQVGCHPQLADAEGVTHERAGGVELASDFQEALSSTLFPVISNASRRVPCAASKAVRNLALISRPTSKDCQKRAGD